MQAKSSDVCEFLFTRVMIFLFKAGLDKAVLFNLSFYQFSTVTLNILFGKYCKTFSWCTLTLREKCPNTELFLVRKQENTDQK